MNIDVLHESDPLLVPNHGPIVDVHANGPLDSADPSFYMPLSSIHLLEYTQ